MSFETPVTATLPLIAHRLLLFRWRTERPAHYARLRSLRQLQQNAPTVAAQRTRAGERTRVSVVITAENVAAALEEVRARMTPTCARANVTRLGAALSGQPFWRCRAPYRVIVAAEVVQPRLADRSRVRIERSGYSATGIGKEL
jgi:hypothetical protein